MENYGDEKGILCGFVEKATDSGPAQSLIVDESLPAIGP